MLTRTPGIRLETEGTGILTHAIGQLLQQSRGVAVFVQPRYPPSWALCARLLLFERKKERANIGAEEKCLQDDAEVALGGG